MTNLATEEDDGHYKTEHNNDDNKNRLNATPRPPILRISNPEQILPPKHFQRNLDHVYLLLGVLSIAYRIYMRRKNSGLNIMLEVQYLPAQKTYK